MENPAPSRLTFRALGSAAAASLLELDRRVLRTIRDLTRAPGTACREYLLGDRTRYVSPLKFGFATITAYVVVNRWTIRTDLDAALDPLVTLEWLWPYLALILLLPAAALQRMLFRNREFVTAECYAAGLFVLGQIALAGGVLIVGTRLGGTSLPPALLVLGTAAYAAWAITGLYDDRHPTVWLRGAMVFLFGAGMLAGFLTAFQAYRFTGWG